MVLTALLTAKPGKREELHQALASLREGIQDQPGCLACIVGQDQGTAPRFHLHLIWEGGEALDRFMGTEVFQILQGALAVLAVASPGIHIFPAEASFASGEPFRSVARAGPSPPANVPESA
ncbi:MAG TPA: antibiotic biosynthesis monooxygenase family protein [Holophagaceae bacterium]|nr:antibiotic biosynthesis monooxygenase family protein [Holophagaceae bacterium]